MIIRLPNAQMRVGDTGEGWLLGFDDVVLAPAGDSFHAVPTGMSVEVGPVPLESLRSMCQNVLEKIAEAEASVHVPEPLVVLPNRQQRRAAERSAGRLAEAPRA